MKVLIAESAGFSPQAIEALQGVGDVTAADLSRAQLLEAVRETEVLWVRLRTPIDREVLDRAPALRAVVTATTGLDHIDLETCEERGVEVFSLRGEQAFLKDILATAEHTILLMLAWLRQLPMPRGTSKKEAGTATPSEEANFEDARWASLATAGWASWSLGCSSLSGRTS